MSIPADRLRTSLRGAKLGVLGGVLGAVVMAMYAMVVSATVKDAGFFTPLYHIASVFLEPKTMMTSMAHGADGDAFYLSAGPAVVGLLVHMFTGAGAGAVFGAAVTMRRLSGLTTTILGGVFGLLVLVVNSFVGLPIAAALFDGGDVISDMPKLAGWGTFTVEHVLFGLVLGAVVATAGSRQPAELRHPAAHPA